MADDVKDIAIFTGTEWQSLSALTAEKVVCTLPIESVDKTVKVDGNSSIFTVSTGNAGQIRLEPGQSSNNYFRVYDPGSLHGAMLCARDSTTNALTVRPYKTTVTGNVYSAFNMLWDYTDDTVDFTNAGKDFILNGYNSPSPTCKGDTYFAFNVGGIGAQTDFTLTAGLHLNVASQLAPDKEAYSILSDGTAPSKFYGQLQTPSVCGLADNDSTITLGGQATLKNSDGSEYVPTDSASIATKADCDANAGGPRYDDTQIKSDLAAEASTRAAADNTLQTNIDAKVWVGTTAQYNQLSKNPTTLYCLTD